MPRYKGAKGKAWKAASDYVRERDDWICITCGIEHTNPRMMHAGHFIPVGLSGSNSALAWDEKNINAQCHHCNVNLGGWGERYAEAMEVKYGPHIVASLRARRDKVESAPPWEELIDYYKARLKKVRCEKYGT